MKINPTGRYLQLMLKSLDALILPDLKSSSAIAEAHFMRGALVDLIKREGGAIEMLRQSIASGDALEAELSLFIGSPIAREAVRGDDFDGLAIEHAALTERLSALCARVSSARQPAAVTDSGVADELLLRAAQWEFDYYVAQAKLPLESELGVQTEPLSPGLSREFLQDFLNSRREPAAAPIDVIAFERAQGGFGKQTYLCRMRDATAVERDVVVRKTDSVPIVMHGFSVLELEYDLLRSLAKTGYPAPRPDLLASKLPGVDGSFYTMDRIPGGVPGTFLGGMHQAPPETMFLQLAQLLAQLHRIPIETFADYLRDHGEEVILESNVAECYRHNLLGWKRYAASVEHLPSPFLNWLFDWLDRHAPRDDRRPVLVHGDFNIHNVLADGGKITGVLDWECADFGAPEQDLAYIRPHIEKHLPWERFLEEYHAHGGPPINPEMMSYTLVYAAVRVNLAGNRGTLNLQRGTNRDLRYSMVELGFTQAFMQMALANVTSSTGVR